MAIMKTILLLLLIPLMSMIGCQSDEDISNKAKYVVVPWSSCETDLGSTLYANTLDAPSAVMERFNKLDIASHDDPVVPIAIFTTEDDLKEKQSQVGARFMILAPSLNGGTTVYILSQREDTIHASSVGSLAYPVLSLAGATSKEEPMTIVNSGELIYAVIGNTAYLLSEWGADIAPDALGELYWSEALVDVSEINLDFSQNKQQ